MSNWLDGKSSENVWGYTGLKLCLTKEQFNKCMSGPVVAGLPNIVKEDELAIVQTHKKAVLLDKPTFIGASILQISIF